MLNASHVRRLGLLVYASVEVATARMGSAHITYFRHIEALYSNCLRWHGNKPIRPVFHGSNSAEKNQVQVCYIRQLHSSVILPLGHTLIYPACPYYLCSINPPGLTGQTILPYWYATQRRPLGVAITSKMRVHTYLASAISQNNEVLGVS